MIISADSNQGDGAIIRVWKQKRHISKDNHNFKNTYSTYLAILLQLSMIITSIAFLHQNMVSATSWSGDKKIYLSYMKPPVSALMPWTADTRWNLNSFWMHETRSAQEQKDRKQGGAMAIVNRIEGEAQWDNVETVKRTKDGKRLRSTPKVIRL